jgi:antitoxin CcdA
MQETLKKRKRSVNVSIEAGLADEAKAAGINMSATLERALNDELKQHRTRTWLEENREALASLNAYIEKHGLPLAKYRVW